jgi:hypothetical protein
LSAVCLVVLLAVAAAGADHDGMMFAKALVISGVLLQVRLGVCSRIGIECLVELLAAAAAGADHN